MTLRCRGQRCPQLEPLPAHAQHEGRRRLAVFHLAIDLEHGFGREGVGGVGGCGRRVNSGKNERGRGVLAGVDEQREFPVPQVEGVLDVELEVLDQLDAVGEFFIFEPFCQSTADDRPDRVVAATGVADGEDGKRRGHERRSA